MRRQAQGWREMRAFEGVDLEDSRVTGWRYASPPGVLVVTLAARVLPRHAEPSHDRPARVVFENATRVEGLCPPAPARPDARDDAAPPGLDSLARLRRDDDGSYRFDATWGEVRVYCDDVRLELDDDARAAA